MSKKEAAGTKRKPAKLTVKRQTIRDLETTKPNAEEVRGGARTAGCDSGVNI